LVSDGAQDDGTLSAGAEAFRLGQFAAARDRFAAALAARRRVLGDAHPEVGAILHNLGLALRANGEGGAAEGCHEEALRIFEASLGPADPMAAKSLSALGGLARERGDATAALRFAGRALAVWMRSLQAGDPQIGWALEELGKAHSGAGDDRAALDSWGASLAILLPRFGEGARLAPVLNNCGVAARALGDLAGARNWFGRAVAADAGLAAARHNFAAVLARLGDEAGARREREVALRQTCVFVQRASQPKQGVLIPSLSDAGNVPLEHILPDRDFTRIWWFLAHDSEPVGKKLPPFGVVFNGIGDPDMDEVAGDGAAGKRLRGFMAARPGMRVLNHPDAVSRTRRDRLEQTLAGIAGAVVPRTCRVAGSAAVAELMRAAAQAGIAPPLLLRPAGAHGGHGVVRVESWDDLDEGALRRSDAWYVSRYCDCRGADGFYRKYRMAIVDRVPLPYHLAISRGWMVHYFSAEMEPHDWKLAEEAAFLADPRAVLGAVAITALGEIGARLDLDFCGVDFAMLPDGRVLVFEANATMLIHLESDAGKLAFKNPSVQKIIYAVRTLVAGPKW
jgi:hypothetical protein